MTWGGISLLNTYGSGKMSKWTLVQLCVSHSSLQVPYEKSSEGRKEGRKEGGREGGTEGGREQTNTGKFNVHLQ